MLPCSPALLLSHPSSFLRCSQMYRLRQYGVLAGGLETGAVVLWNPAKIINAEPGDAAAASQVASLAKHTGAVRYRNPEILAHRRGTC